ncbi:hypothetical protein ACODNH_12865 [Haloarcula sp. NS06]|uniref:hypothetical protein n=1 Tax=unclassified Haloarcula TaxID=2624677 RepID=UPI0027B5A632|nr:hypothetical protein [Haloarcula sp. H-GB4]MDQ2071164.1 hypothetical protein [Haloarcula sp. H-GB4]
MVDAFTLYLVGIGVLGVGFFAVYVYYEFQTAAGRPYRQRGVTRRGITGATVVPLATVLLFGFVGEVNIFASDDVLRAVGYATVVLLFVFAAGLIGLNISHTLGRRWRRLHPDNDVPTGTLESGEVACTGEVTAAAVGTAPVTDRRAVCWSWHVEVLNPHGVGSKGDQFTTVEADQGGVTFAVDDGTGPVLVDPKEATLDLSSTRALSFDSEDGPPPAFPNPAPKVERTHDDKPRTYEESIVAPGDRVAIAGTASETADGLLVSGPDAHVAIGSLSTVATRYRNKALLYGLAGVVGVGVAVDWLAALYGVF